jgi:hypothetical protein
MFRKSMLPSLDDKFLALKIGDWPLFVLLSQNGWIGYLDRMMAHYRIHENNSWNNRATEFKLRAMESMAWYLCEHVNEGSRHYWKDTILALAFKDMVLALKSLRWSSCFAKLKYFVQTSAKLHRPFWLLNCLWPYWRANHASNSTRCRKPQRTASCGQQTRPDAFREGLRSC